MKFHTSGNGNGLDDLYILPENEQEQNKVVAYLKTANIDYRIVRSDVKGQDWYGKSFILAAFAESRKDEIAKLTN